MKKRRFELRCDNRSKKISVKASNEAPYTVGCIVILEDLKNEILINFPKGIFEV